MSQRQHCGDKPLGGLTSNRDGAESETESESQLASVSVSLSVIVSAPRGWM
jgi:hypothetical protein